MPCCLRVRCCVQGIDPSLVERFPEFEFKCDIMPLTFPTDITDAQLPLANQPTTLTTVLRQLRGLRAPGAVIRVGRHWASFGVPPGHPSPPGCRVWTHGAVQAMSGALDRDLQHLHIVAHFDYEMGRWYLRRFLDHGPNIRNLWVLGLNPQRLTLSLADRVWPWDELTIGNFPYIDTLDVCNLAKLPHPGQSTAARRLRCNALVELNDKVREVSTNAACCKHMHCSSWEAYKR